MLSTSCEMYWNRECLDRTSLSWFLSSTQLTSGSSISFSYWSKLCPWKSSINWHVNLRSINLESARSLILLIFIDFKSKDITWLNMLSYACAFWLSSYFEHCFSSSSRTSYICWHSSSDTAFRLNMHEDMLANHLVFSEYLPDLFFFFPESSF